jgi:hypothetical protein
MLLSDLRLYQETREIKLGSGSLAGPLGELGRRIGEKYGVHVLTITYTTPQMESLLSTPRLGVIVDTRAELTRMRKDAITLPDGVAEDIIATLRTVAGGNHDHFPDLDKAFFFVEALEETAVIKTLWSVERDHGDEIGAAFPDANLWRVSAGMGRLVVFYRTDQDVRRNEADGSSARIRDLCFALAQKYDDFGYLRPESFPIAFDSKENLDKNYEGNLYFYHL